MTLRSAGSGTAPHVAVAHRAAGARPHAATRPAGPIAVATTLSMGVVATVAASGAVLAATGRGWGAVDDVLVVVGLLAGVPHGAVDHLVPGLRGHRPGPGRLVLLAVAYAAIAATSWWALRSAPAVGLAGFLALSVLHFGTGEVAFDRIRGAGPQDAVRSLGSALVVGATAVILPLALHPVGLIPFLRLLVPGWDGRLPAPLTLTVAGSVAGVALATVAARLATGRRLAALELGLLVALAAWTPPVVAVATYFGAWHAVRHTAVLVCEDTAAHGAGAAARLARQAAAPVVAVLVVLAALWWFAARGDLERFVAQDLWVLAALTVPHAAVVWWLDRTRTVPAREAAHP